MKYTTTIVINLPIKAFLKILLDEQNMKHWMRGLLSHEHLSGERGEEGSRMSMRFLMNKREMEMVETILKKELPYKLYVAYDSKGVHNIQKNHFTAQGDKTLWSSESEFIFESFWMKTMGFLLPGMFKKQSKQYAEDFKKFAEEGISVLDM